ncbi:MAG: aminotransferase class I/II-fold pyridoxal phosphate-dependent enzyme [Pseudomonadales bacterium]|nr:aminotransferase class I/II-fold pyridoxal phosphate-dependent enzyme [Pseudomonadales bacterium]
MLTLSSKLPAVGTTIFTVMSQMAQEHNAINLSQGFPDFSIPAELSDLLARYVRDGFNQYPPMTGVPYLREQIALKTQRLYGVNVDPDSEVTVTSGATEALFVAVQALVRPGEEVIVFDPAYDSYEPAITLAQGVTRHLPLLPPGFAIDWDRLAATINPRTRAIMINSPHNPCGSVLSRSDLEKLAALIGDRPIAVISDEVYEHMVYDGERHVSALEIDGLRERSFVISSFGKTCHATGWKVAYCIAPAELTTEFRKVHQFVTFTTHTPTQWALAEFIDKYPEHYLNLSDFYQQKRDVFLDAMRGSAFRMTPSRGTYFQLADYSDITDLTDTDFAALLTREYKVAVIPVSVFYADPPPNHYIRFCFAKAETTLQEAASRIAGLREITP